jgi:hypothetical protein
MNNYEGLFIVKADLKDEDAKNVFKALNELVAKHGGTSEVFGLAQNSGSNSCGILYQTSDYQATDTPEGTWLLNPSYIDRCLTEFLKVESKVEIFTDDRRVLNTYARNKFVNLNFAETNIEVFRRILCFQNFAISSSTLSLMATALSENIKLLIRPARWERNLLEDNLTDGLECKVIYDENGFISRDFNLQSGRN